MLVAWGVLLMEGHRVYNRVSFQHHASRGRHFANERWRAQVTQRGIWAKIRGEIGCLLCFALALSILTPKTHSTLSELTDKYGIQWNAGLHKAELGWIGCLSCGHCGTRNKCAIGKHSYEVTPSSSFGGDPTLLKTFRNFFARTCQAGATVYHCAEYKCQDFVQCFLQMKTGRELENMQRCQMTSHWSLKPIQMSITFRGIKSLLPPTGGQHWERWNSKMDHTQLFTPECCKDFFPSSSVNGQCLKLALNNVNWSLIRKKP